MKVLISIISIHLLFFIVGSPAIAQKQNVCKGETVILRLKGYQTGEIIWQKSKDQNNWEDIEGSNDNIYAITVNDSLYYRAKVTEGTCNPYYSDTTKINILPKPAVADAGEDIDIACIPVSLNANTPTIGTGKWKIISGSGGRFNDPTSPTAGFTGEPGLSYTLEWSVGNQCDTTTDQVEVNLMPAITAQFNADTSAIKAGDTISFTDQSTGNPTSWSWDFGDGDSATTQNPSHVYDSAGSYSVGLIASHACGTDTIIKNNCITVEEKSKVCPASFTDSRDGQTYQAVQIGDQCWMAENLNYDQEAYGNDWCYENKMSNCNTYGRLYDWIAIMQGRKSNNDNPSKVKGVCPSGWHLPSDEE